MNGMGTKVTRRVPFWGSSRPTQILALCEDGRLRRTAYLAIEPMNFFAIRAAVRIAGKWVPGFITTGEDEDRSTIYYFIAFKKAVAA